MFSRQKKGASAPFQKTSAQTFSADIAKMALYRDFKDFIDLTNRPVNVEMLLSRPSPFKGEGALSTTQRLNDSKT
jgi:hypothetical protein